jgi:hypothetical protein
MAESYEIPIGDGGTPVRVPAWATEATAREMAKYNEATAKALTDLLRQTSRDKKVVMENQKLFRGMKKATEQRVEDNVKSTKERTKADKQYTKTVKETNNILMEAGKDIMDVFSKDSLAAITKSLIGLGVLGAGLGFAIGQVETYAAQIANLTNVGIGLGVSMADLRQQAAATGLAIEDYGNLVLTSGDTLRAIGDNAQDGARRFSILSREVFEASRQFNNFGLTNQEANEILMQEIELRRRSGLEQQELTDGLADSFTQLMAETTAMAVMTGQDRREMLRRRQEMATNASIEAARMAAIARGGEDFLDAVGAISDASGAGGDVGNQIGEAIMIAITQNRDFRSIGDGMLGRMAALDTEFGAALTRIQEFVRANYETMDPGELRLQLMSMFAEIPDAFDSADFDRLGLLAERGVDGAADIISLVAELRGISSDVEENRENLDMALQQLAETPLLALASEMQTAMNRLRESAMNTAFGLLDLTEQTENFDQALVDSIRGLSDNFGEGATLFEGLTETFDDLTESMNEFKRAVILAIGALGVLAVTPGLRTLLGAGVRRGGGGLLRGAGRGIGSLGRGIAGLFGGAAAATAGSQATRQAAIQASRQAATAALQHQTSRILGSLIARIAGGALVAAVIPDRMGDGTLSGPWEEENPFPENGTQAEQLQWQLDREAAMNGTTPRQVTQAEIDRADADQRRRNTPLFEDLSPFEQREMRLNTPGSRGAYDNMHESGMLDPETHAVLTGRSIPGRERTEERLLEAVEELVRETRESRQEFRRTRRAIED